MFPGRQIQNQIQNERYCQVYLHELVFVTEATAVQQNDSDRTKTEYKKKNKKEQVNWLFFVQEYNNWQICMYRYIMWNWSVDYVC